MIHIHDDPYDKKSPPACGVTRGEYFIISPFLAARIVSGYGPVLLTGKLCQVCLSRKSGLIAEIQVSQMVEEYENEQR